MKHPHPDAVAACVINAFHALPPKFKPRTLPDGRKEWVPLAGVVLSRGDGTTSSSSSSSASDLMCAGLATGMKCLPREKLALAKGNVLHDWHAEVLALRAFNRWILDECAQLAKKETKLDERSGSEWVRWTKRGEAVEGEHEQQQQQQRQQQQQLHQPFEMKDDVTIHMYASEAPCGDASMELTMAEQEDATPWPSPPPGDRSGEGDGDDMPGRGHFDRMGIVRRKPARPDAPPTWSKSCSDKLAMKQVTGLLNGVTALLMRPERCYLSTLVLPEKQLVPQACERAFGARGRMKAFVEEEGGWRAGYAYRPFEVMSTGNEFAFSKRTLSGDRGAAVSSNLSALYTPYGREVLINGVLQGRKQSDPLGASCASRRRMWEGAIDVAAAAGSPALVDALKKAKYEDVKAAGVVRQGVKRAVRESALKGWKRNLGDEDWGLEDGMGD